MTVRRDLGGLGYLKLRDTESFSTMLLDYDLLARRWVRYGYIYPYAEPGSVCS